MIISDLQYIETVDASDVQGSFSWKGYFGDLSIAAADADAVAVGDLSIALTNTSAVAVPGGASSSSSSLAVSASKGYKKYTPKHKKYKKY